MYSENLAHLRMCGIPFEKFSKRKEVHVCNVAVSKTVSNNVVVDFPLEGLRDYLIEEGKLKESDRADWLDREIYP